MLGFGVYGHYTWAQGWLLGAGLDQMFDDFESPARILRIIQPVGSAVVDAPAAATNLTAWIERRYEAGARGAWYWQAGVGVGRVSADDVTGPVQGGGTYRITTDADTELLLLGGLGYRYRIAGNWNLNSSVGLNYHFADWQVRDLNSGAIGNVGNYAAYTIRLGIDYSF